MQKYERNHALTRRPAITQILSYLIVILTILVFSLCIQNNLHSSTSNIILIILYYTTWTGIIITASITSCSDPSDSYLKQKQPKVQKGTTTLYCSICRNVVHQDTRHCKICNICIRGFDHHCVWINHCIGIDNYKIFFTMLLCVWINFGCFIASVAVVWSEGIWMEYLGAMVANWIVCALVVIFLLLVTGLIVFHIFLICNQLTTYEYLISKKKPTKVAPQPQRSHENEQQLQQVLGRSQNTLIQSMNNNLKISNNFPSFQTDLASKENDKKQNQKSKSDRVSMIFEAAEQKSQGSQKIIPVQKIQVKMSIDIQKSSHSRSETQTIGDSYQRKNKSMDIIFGAISHHQPQPRISFKSQVNNQRKAQGQEIRRIRTRKAK